MVDGPIPEERKIAAGEFSAWLRSLRRGRARGSAGARVPCGECSGCCRSFQFIHIAPHEVETLACIPKPLLFAAPGRPKGHVLVGYDEKGECPMWTGDRCSIYERRPQTCRDYDCRIFAAAGIALDESGPAALIARRVGCWAFAYATEDSARQARAVRAAGAYLQQHRSSFPPHTIPCNPVQVALLAIEIRRVFLDRGGPEAGKMIVPPRAAVVKAVMRALGPSDVPGGPRRQVRATSSNRERATSIK